MDTVNNKLRLGDPYSKKDLASLLNEEGLVPVREGIYSCKNHNSLLLFVDLIKAGKDDRFHFNDYFQDDYFHWDSQTTQHINSPRIQQMVNHEKEINLFVRISQKLTGLTQPFLYCGRLKYDAFDENTSKPVHIIFLSLDYDENNKNLQEIYNWRPEIIGKTSSNDSGKKLKRRGYTKPNLTERQGLVTSRVGQGYYRQQILEKWNYKCAVTNIDLKEVLIASHINPWKLSTDDERLDPDNGILLSPNIDALFDKHIISFEDDGKIIISPKLNVDQQKLFGIDKDMALSHVTPGMLVYLMYHRRIFNEHN